VSVALLLGWADGEQMSDDLTSEIAWRWFARFPLLEYFEMDVRNGMHTVALEKTWWRRAPNSCPLGGAVKVSAEEGLRARNWHDWNESGVRISPFEVRESLFYFHVDSC